MVLNNFFFGVCRREDSPVKAFLPEDTYPVYAPKILCDNTAWPRQLTWQYRMGLFLRRISVVGWKSISTFTPGWEAISMPD